MLHILTPFITPRRFLLGALASVLAFALLGTVAALWDNPFFVRMTPAAGPEVALLGIQSLLLGLYVLVRRPTCSAGGVTAGSVVSFLGLACPVCNKILLLVFGGDLLMTYFEPVRIYVAALGVALTMGLVIWEWRQARVFLTIGEVGVR